MTVHDREWPPDPRPPRPAPPPPLALWMSLWMFLVTPFAALLVALLPGEHSWALAVWPGGWILATTVALGCAWRASR